MQCQRVHRDKSIQRAMWYIRFIAGSIDGECYVGNANICGKCYREMRPYIVPLEEELIIKPDAVLLLSRKDLYEILRKYGLPQCIDDMRILAAYESLDQKSVILGIFLLEEYRLLFLNDKRLVTVEDVQSDDHMRRCSKNIARIAEHLLPVV